MRDLACPTWGLGISTSANGDTITTIGPPWLPLIFPPMEIFSLDAKWESECTGFWSDFWTLNTLFLFDPPIALTPALLLAPTPLAHIPAESTTTSERLLNPAKTARPASVPSDPVASPAKTGDPGTPSPVVTPANPPVLPDNSAGPPKSAGSPPSDPKAPLDPAGPGESSGKSNTSPSSDPDPTSGDSPPSDPKVPLDPAGPEDSSGESNTSPPSDPDPPSDSSPTSPTDPKVPIIPGSLQHGTTSTHVQGLGAIIFNAFGKAGLESVEASTRVLSSQSDSLVLGSDTISLPSSSQVYLTQAFTVANQVFTPNPTAFSIAGTTLSAGGPGVTISNSIISLGQNGALKVGSSTISLPTHSEPPFNQAYVIAGHTFTPHPSSFIIGSATISAGGPAATVNGTPIRLLPSGILFLGTSTISLLPSQASSSYDITIDGFDIKGQHSPFIVVDGVTVNAAAVAMTISGTRVSLEAGGQTVDIGTGSFAAATTATALARVGDGGQVFAGGQERGREVAVGLVCWVLVLWSVGWITMSVC